MNNPFTLTFGQQPEMLISRYENIDNVVNVFQNTTLSRTYLIEGIRGSGKTVLMTSIADKLSENKDWIVINLNPNLDLLDDMARRLNNACISMPDLMKSGFNISVAGVGIGVSGNDFLNDNISIIENILNQIKNKKKFEIKKH